MKMIYAGLSTSPNVAAENWRYNCTINKACQKKWYIPIDKIADLDLYFELPFMPTTYTLSLVDFCNGNINSLTSTVYVVGQHTRGFYAVFSNLVGGGTLPMIFYLKAEFSDGSQTAVFYSNDFTPNDCNGLTAVEGCYNNAAIGSDAFDVNGVYYGYPVTGGAVLGNKDWRYYHRVYVRYAKVTNTKQKLSLSLFNSKKTYKATNTKTFNFGSEIVPEFYKDEIFGVLSRGNITVGGKPYLVASEVDISVHSEESQLWIMDIPLQEEMNTYFSCKETVCRSLPAPVKTCCVPTILSAVTEVVDVPVDLYCENWYVTGNDENSFFDYIDCATGQSIEINIGRGAIEVCAREKPTGQGLQFINNGRCAN